MARIWGDEPISTVGRSVYYYNHYRKRKDMTTLWPRYPTALDAKQMVLKELFYHDGTTIAINS